MRPALLLLCASLAVGCLPKSPTGGPVAVTAADAPPIQPVSPAYFATGSSKLASQGDYDRVNQAAAQLKSNPRLYVVLTGYTDADGRPDSNLALSQSRSEYVADLLKKAGCDDRRIYAKGMGEVASTGENVSRDRRVEFVFFSAGSGQLPTADEILASAGISSGSATAAATAATQAASAATASASKGGKGEKADKGGGGATVTQQGQPIMEKTGIPELDSFFGKGQALLDKLRGNQANIAKAKASLTTVLGVAEGADVGAALAELKASAAGAITIKMEGIKPKLAVKPGATPKISQAITAMNQMVESMSKALADLTTLPKEAMALVNEAKTLPSQLPNMAKAAGLKPTQIPKLAKMVKGNIGLLADIPKETKSLIDEITSTFKLIQSTFAG